MASDRGNHVDPRRALGILASFLILALPIATLARAAAPTPAGTATEAAALSAALAGSTRLARTRLAPEARALARALPHAADRIGSLRQPAATTEEQLGIALGQLQQMTVLAYDPHYLPALIAVGRAYFAASGTDPLTGTAVDPEYAGLGRELAGSAAALGRDASHGAQLSRTVRSLTTKLSLERRRSAQLAAALDRLRRSGSPR
jgi:hypothetical protein